MIRVLFISVYAAFFVLSGFSSGVANAADKIKICYLEWGRYGGVKLPNFGYIPDLVTQVFTNAGYEVELDIVPWPRCTNMTASTRYDILAAAWIGPQFDDKFDYLTSTHADSINFITLRSSGISDGSLEALQERMVGYLRDSGGLERFREVRDRHKTYAAASLKTLLTMLEKGRVEVILADPVQVLHEAERISSDLTEKLRILKPPLTKNVAAPLISKNHPKKSELIAAYGASYRDLVANGMYKRLNALHGIYLEPVSNE